jgi:hypothetical protein
MKTYAELELENLKLQSKLCEANMNFYSLLREKLASDIATKEIEITQSQGGGDAK